MMKYLLLSISLLTLVMAGCEEKSPSRDHIPVIKERFSKLEAAVKAQDRAALDSLMSVKMLDIEQDSDSLLHFIYGSDYELSFERFGDYEIFYTNKKARIDCFLMDSTGARDRPAVFTMIFDDDKWLLKRFEAGVPDTSRGDTTDTAQ